MKLGYPARFTPTVAHPAQALRHRADEGVVASVSQDWHLEGFASTSTRIRGEHMKHLFHISIVVVWLVLAVALQIIGWGGAVIPLAVLGIALEVGWGIWLVHLKRQRRQMALQQKTAV